MKTMKIKMIKGTGKWYGKHIGRIYQVKLVCANAYIIRNYRTLLRTVDFDDAEIINND